MNPPSFSRRALLQRAGCFTLAAGAAWAATPATPLAAAEPIVRTHGPRFKFSLAAYSYRSLLQGKDAPLTLADFIDDCAKFGLAGTELTSYYFPTPVTDAYLVDLKRRCFLAGLDVSGTAVGNDFGHPPGDARDKQLAHVKAWIDHATLLGAPAIRIFAGHVKPGQSADEAHRLMVDGMAECCRYASQRGVFLALENHGGPTATAAGLLRLVRDVDSPWLAVNLDTGNFHGDDIYGELAACAPYAVNVQVKVVVSGPDKVKRPTDYPRLAGILRDAGYRGYIVLEYEEPGDPRVECPRALDELRTAFA